MHFEESQSFLSSQQQGSQVQLESQFGYQSLLSSSPIPTGQPPPAQIINCKIGTVNLISSDNSSNSNKSPSLSPHVPSTRELAVSPNPATPQQQLVSHARPSSRTEECLVCETKQLLGTTEPVSQKIFGPSTEKRRMYSPLHATPISEEHGEIDPESPTGSSTSTTPKQSPMPKERSSLLGKPQGSGEVHIVSKKQKGLAIVIFLDFATSYHLHPKERSYMQVKPQGSGGMILKKTGSFQ